MRSVFSAQMAHTEALLLFSRYNTIFQQTLAENDLLVKQRFLKKKFILRY